MVVRSLIVSTLPAALSADAEEVKVALPDPTTLISAYLSRA